MIKAWIIKKNPLGFYEPIYIDVELRQIDNSKVFSMDNLDYSTFAKALTKLGVDDEQRAFMDLFARKRKLMGNAEFILKPTKAFLEEVGCAYSREDLAQPRYINGLFIYPDFAASFDFLNFILTGKLKIQRCH